MDHTAHRAVKMRMGEVEESERRRETVGEGRGGVTHSRVQMCRIAVR